MKKFMLGFLSCLVLFVFLSFAYIRKGGSYTGQIAYNVTGKYIREGQSSTGRIVYYIDYPYIREGQTSTGRILYTITDK